MIETAKPILFSTPMVRSVLNDCKTQTRRVMKPQPMIDNDGMWSWKDCQWMDGGIGFPASGIIDHAKYQPGDILWVRETWRMYEKAVGKGESFRVNQFYAYKADEDNPDVPKCCEWYDNIKPLDGGLIRKYKTGSWRPSIFMPREAARIFLRVKRVWVERVQEVTAEDCIAEGIDLEWSDALPKPSYMSIAYSETRVKPAFVKAYGDLWDEINAKRDGGKYAWDANPWVWVYEFERCAKPEGWPVVV